MRRLLDSMDRDSHAPTRGLVVFAPLLEDSCSHRWLGVGVDGPKYTLAFGDSSAHRVWRAVAQRKAFQSLFAAMITMAPFGRRDGCSPERPVLVRIPRLTYPHALLSRGIGGQVLVEAIIDTLGHVEPSSIHVLETPDPGFIPPVMAYLTEARFSPARAHGQALRVSVTFPFIFSINGAGPVF